MDQVETTEPSESLVAPSPVGQRCDRDDCENPAVFSYTWDWGEHGICCAEHQVRLAQLAAQLKRTVQFVALQPGAEPPLERSERVKLKAEVYAVEAELEETKGRNADLYRQAGGLAAQVQSLTVRHAEAQAQLRDAKAEADRESARADQLRRENADMVDEITRLRLLVDTGETQPGT